MDIKKELIKAYFAILVVAGIAMTSILVAAINPSMFLIMFLAQTFLVLGIAWKFDLDLKFKGDDENGES